MGGPSISAPAVLLDPNLDGPAMPLLIFGFMYSSASIMLMSAPSDARFDSISFSSCDSENTREVYKRIIRALHFDEVDNLPAMSMTVTSCNDRLV